MLTFETRSGFLGLERFAAQALLATRDAALAGRGLPPELPYHRPQRVGIHLVRPRRSGVAPVRCRAAHAPWPTRPRR